MPLLQTAEQRIVLASRSPRRIELLKKIIPHFEVNASTIDEHVNGILHPGELVEHLSLLKAEQVANGIETGIIIGADSIVVSGNNILGKPANAHDSQRMLRLLSGTWHEVYTGFAVFRQPLRTIVSGYEITRVKFRELEEWEIERYIASGQSLDKAGAYGIQDDAAVFVEAIDGCYYNVVGLPITKLFLVLKKILT